MLKRAWFNIRYSLLLSLLWLVGKLPTWFLYHVMLDVVYFFVYKIFGYRVGIVRRNLQNSFPEKSPVDLYHIERRFYRHLAEVFIDTVDIISITRKEMEKRIVFEDVENHNGKTQGKSWIAALAHYGTWEYFSAYQFYTDSQVVGVYHPLHSKVFEKLYYYARSRFGMKPVAMHNTLRYIVESRRDNKPIVLGLIADQTPPYHEKPNWFEFLSQPTNFYMGPEKLALKFKMPVYFIHTYKGNRARYRASFEMIYDGMEEVAPGEITRRYAEKLEQMIREKPWLWMWSHRRWKHADWLKKENM